MIVLEDILDILRKDACVQIVDKVRNAYNFKVGLRLGKPRSSNAVIVSMKRILDVFLNFLEVRS